MVLIVFCGMSPKDFADVGVAEKFFRVYGDISNIFAKGKNIFVDYSDENGATRAIKALDAQPWKGSTIGESVLAMQTSLVILLKI